MSPDRSGAKGQDWDTGESEDELPLWQEAAKRQKGGAAAPSAAAPAGRSAAPPAAVSVPKLVFADGTAVALELGVPVELGRADVVGDDHAAAAVSRRQARVTWEPDGTALVESLGQNATGIRLAGGEWKMTRRGTERRVAPGTTISLTRTFVPSGLVDITVSLAADDVLAPWEPSKTALVGRLDEMERLSDMYETGIRDYSKVYQLSRVHKAAEQHLPDGVVTVEDINSLSCVEHVGPWAVDQLLQLHTDGESDYLLALRDRTRADA